MTLVRLGRLRRDQSGLTLLELVVAAALLAILASAALPLYEVTVRREREVELRAALRTIRRAIDDFNKSYIASGGAGAPGAGPGPLPGAAPPGGVPGAPGAGTQPGLSGLYQRVPLIDVSQFDPVDSKGYPPDLKTLVEGVAESGGGTDEANKVKFLRRVPLDPMIPYDRVDPNDPNFGWGVRSYQDAWDATVWGRQNVYDVFTKAGGTALDGSKYKDW